jgi:hypothetical protein
MEGFPYDLRGRCSALKSFSLRPALAGLASGGLSLGRAAQTLPPVTYVTGVLAGSSVFFHP